MRRIQLLFIAASLFLFSATSLADQQGEVGSEPESFEPVASQEESAAAPSEAVDELEWDSFDDPDFAPTAENPEGTTDVESVLLDPTTQLEEVEVVAEVQSEDRVENEIELSEAPGPKSSKGIVLGPQGIDDQGRVGRLHTVSSGETLWDLAAAYLGTPWVWPSVWIDNDGIANPHLIEPGDHIWITANEMRAVSETEAESFLDAAVSDSVGAEFDLITMSADEGALQPDEMPSVDPEPPLAALEVADDDGTILEAISGVDPTTVPGQSFESPAQGLQITVSRRDAMGFVTAEDMAGASSIVDSSTERTFLAAGDPVILGMGEGDVEIGDEFTIFRAIEEVRDVETNRILGHHVDILGWLKVRELTGDTSIAEIRISYSEMRRGVRVMPRPKLSRRVTSRSTPDAIEGKVVFLPSERSMMSGGGYVYLNRGEFHGVEIGSELEVYDPGFIVNDRSRRVDVMTPDHHVAKLIVVSVTAESSVAFVVNSNRELEVGDDVRPRVSRLARR